MDRDMFDARDAAPREAGIHVGIGGWVYAPWRDNFYPKGLVQRRELEYASRQVGAIEVNSTYYRAQSPATYAKWREQTPPGFVFSAKAPMRIMQARNLARTVPQVEDFLGGIAALGDRLGPIVWQFDAGLRPDRAAFAEFLALLPARTGGLRLRYVLDVREPGFVDAGYVELVRRHGMATVFTDSTEYPCFADLSGGLVYARLMRARASEAEGYPPDQLDRWAARARAWHAGGDPDDLPHLAPPAPARPREVFLFFIAAAKQRNPAAAMALMRRLGQR